MALRSRATDPRQPAPDAPDTFPSLQDWSEIDLCYTQPQMRADMRLLVTLVSMMIFVMILITGLYLLISHLLPL